MNVQKSVSLLAIVALLFISQTATAAITSVDEETCPIKVKKEWTPVVREIFHALHPDLEKLDRGPRGETIVEESFRLFSALFGQDNVLLYTTKDRSSKKGIDLAVVDKRDPHLPLVIFIEAKCTEGLGEGPGARTRGSNSDQLSRHWISKNLELKRVDAGDDYNWRAYSPTNGYKFMRVWAKTQDFPDRKKHTARCHTEYSIVRDGAYPTTDHIKNKDGSLEDFLLEAKNELPLDQARKHFQEIFGYIQRRELQFEVMFPLGSRLSDAKDKFDKLTSDALTLYQKRDAHGWEVINVLVPGETAPLPLLNPVVPQTIPAPISPLAPAPSATKHLARPAPQPADGEVSASKAAGGSSRPASSKKVVAAPNTHAALASTGPLPLTLVRVGDLDKEIISGPTVIDLSRVESTATTKPAKIKISDEYKKSIIAIIEKESGDTLLGELEIFFASSTDIDENTRRLITEKVNEDPKKLRRSFQQSLGKKQKREQAKIDGGATVPSVKKQKTGHDSTDE